MRSTFLLDELEPIAVLDGADQAPCTMQRSQRDCCVASLMNGVRIAHGWALGYETTKAGLQHPSNRGSYISLDAVIAHYQTIARANDSEARLERRIGQTIDDIEGEIRRGKPVFVAHVVEPFNAPARIAMNAILWPLGALFGDSVPRSLTGGESRVHRFYPHLSVVVGVYRLRADRQQRVLRMIDPWFGYFLPLTSSPAGLITMSGERFLDQRQD
jgi:hypothetical protein